MKTVQYCGILHMQLSFIVNGKIINYFDKLTINTDAASFSSEIFSHWRTLNSETQAREKKVPSCLEYLGLCAVHVRSTHLSDMTLMDHY